MFYIPLINLSLYTLIEFVVSCSIFHCQVYSYMVYLKLIAHVLSFICQVYSYMLYLKLFPFIVMLPLSLLKYSYLKLLLHDIRSLSSYSHAFRRSC